MTNSNITIESLFEKDSELEYWELRERARLSGIEGSDLFQLLKAAHIKGIVEMLPNNVIKFLGEIKHIEKHYKTEIREGVKCPNNLCTAVKFEMQAILENVATSTDNIEVWEKRLNDSIAYQSKLNPRCGLPYVMNYNNDRYKRKSIVVYASKRVYTTSMGHFLSISCEPLNDDIQCQN